MSAYLKRVSTSSGFLKDCPVEFAPSLTCIIGARGTCKSTLIESIRFAFETEGITKSPKYAQLKVSSNALPGMPPLRVQRWKRSAKRMSAASES